jgi:hypothetical protein
MKKTMKNLLIIILTIILFSNCKNSSTQNNQVKPISDTTFYFCIKDFYNETSKDSHHYFKTFSLEKGVLYYDYVYNGFPGHEEAHDEKQLNDSTINTIKEKLKELSLYMNYTRKFPIEKTGLSSESGYLLTIIADTSQYSVSISGDIPYDINDEVYNHLSNFNYFINNLFTQKP